jgi:hypothetical protein
MGHLHGYHVHELAELRAALAIFAELVARKVTGADPRQERYH